MMFTKKQMKDIDKNMLILVDADIVFHRAAFSCEWEFNFEDQKVRTADPDMVADVFHNILGSILQHTKSSRFLMCWSSKSNFRHDVFPEYKANRKTVRRPEVDNALVWHLKHRYPSLEVNGMEADDLMGILSGPGTIIASDDKDLLTVPGLHFKPRRADLGVFSVSKEEAHAQWFKQILMGDTIDGYKGIPGVGEKKSQKFLDNGGYVWSTVLEAYSNAGMSEEDALVTARLARILHPGEWDYTNNKPKLWSPN